MKKKLPPATQGSQPSLEELHDLLDSLLAASLISLAFLKGRGADKADLMAAETIVLSAFNLKKCFERGLALLIVSSQTGRKSSAGEKMIWRALKKIWGAIQVINRQIEILMSFTERD